MSRLRLLFLAVSTLSILLSFVSAVSAENKGSAVGSFEPVESTNSQTLGNFARRYCYLFACSVSFPPALDLLVISRDSYSENKKYMESTIRSNCEIAGFVCSFSRDFITAKIKGLPISIVDSSSTMHSIISVPREDITLYKNIIINNKKKTKHY